MIMNMPLCSKCKKNVAVVFVTRLENGKAVNEGLCLQCAKELNIKPVTDMIERFGITDSDIENVAQELQNANPEEMISTIWKKTTRKNLKNMTKKKRRRSLKTNPARR